MITPEYCQLLARYGRWMNERMYAAVASMSDDERKRDRGAFFGSIHRTLSHLVWADSIWLARFTGAPYAERAYGADLFDAFENLAAAKTPTPRCSSGQGNSNPPGLPRRSNTGPPATAGCAVFLRGSRPRTCSTMRPIIAGS